MMLQGYEGFIHRQSDLSVRKFGGEPLKLDAINLHVARRADRLDKIRPSFYW
jgi:hypothetical protein